MEFHCSQLIKHCRVCGGRLMVTKKSKRTIYNSQSYKKELKLAFGIHVIVDHIEIHPPSFCKPCELSMERVLNASSQKFGHALQVESPCLSKCEVSKELIITEFNGMIIFRCASILRCR